MALRHGRHGHEGQDAGGEEEIAALCLLAFFITAVPGRAAAEASQGLEVCEAVKQAAAVFGELNQAADEFRGLKTQYVFAPPRSGSAEADAAARREIRGRHEALRKQRERLLAVIAERKQALAKAYAAIRKHGSSSDETARSCAGSVPTLYHSAQRNAAGLEGEDPTFRNFTDQLQVEGILPLQEKSPPEAGFLEDIDCDGAGLDPVRRLAEHAAEARRIRAGTLRLVADLEEVRPKGKAPEALQKYLAQRTGLRKPLEARLDDLTRMRAQVDACSRTSRARNISNEFSAMASVERDLDEARYPMVQAALYAPGEVSGLWAAVYQALSVEEAEFQRIQNSKEFRLAVDHPPPSATPASPESYAVVIGISGYRSVPEVQFADRDARTMRDYLIASMGFPETNVRLLENEGASKAELEKTLGRWLRNQVTEKSRVFVFFAGHGAPDPVSGDAFLVPHDGDPSYPEETAFPISRLMQGLAALPSPDVTVVLDACFSGGGGRSVLAKGARPLVNVMKQEAVGPNTVELAASGIKQISTFYPEGRHGLLTYFLLEGLQGKADADADRKLTTRELFDYVKPRVEREARKQNVEQVPTLLAGSESAQSRVWLKLKP